MARKPTNWVLVTRREWWAVIAYVLALNLDRLLLEDWQALSNLLVVTASAWAIFTLWAAPDRPHWRLGDDR